MPQGVHTAAPAFARGCLKLARALCLALLALEEVVCLPAPVGRGWVRQALAVLCPHTPGTASAPAYVSVEHLASKREATLWHTLARVRHKPVQRVPFANTYIRRTVGTIGVCSGQGIPDNSASACCRSPTGASLSSAEPCIEWKGMCRRSRIAALLSESSARSTGFFWPRCAQ